MNKPTSQRARARFALRSTIAWPVAAVLPMIGMMAFAGSLPSGANVTAGQVVVSTPKPGSLQVNQTSQRGVIRWSDFNIGQGNQVSFVQPGTGAATLNIVSGPGASTIAGSLQSTGSVYLVNPSGILITSTGLVDTGAGFIASTLGISESDFMNGTLRFNGAGGSVVNQGQIRTAAGGAVALLGSRVSNEGVIEAPLGKVGLGAAQSATLDLGGDGFLQVLLPAGTTTDDGQPLVVNSGVIHADGGVVALKAATVLDAVRNAINMPGEIRASAISGHDGAIVLDGGAGGAVTVAGTLDASARSGAVDGGGIDVVGATIALEGAQVAATGVDRGGEVRIGGAFQGGRAQDPASAQTALYIGRFGPATAIADAARTDIDAASTIDVSATGAHGAGGTVVVWSDQATTMLGQLSATGGATGGAVEISSASQVQAIALTRLHIGSGGSLLLDPANIQITDGASTGTSGDLTYGTNPSGTTQITTADVLAQLDAGINLKLQASNDITWTTFNASVQPTGGLVDGGNLTLSAGRSIILSGSFTTQGGTWTMTANDTAAHGVVSSERQAGSATIDLGGAQFINSNGHLDLSVLDGAGNAEHDADGIRLGVYSGDSLTAYVAPTATGPANGSGGTFPTRITLAGNDQAAGAIILTGNLENTMGSETISAQQVIWTGESTGSTIYGEGTLKFIENGQLTRFGTFNGTDAVRLGLGDSIVASASRTYGDADPAVADLGSPQLHVLASSNTQPADALGSILAPGSLVTSGPGVTANVGTSTLTVSASSSIATGGPLQSGYFIDLTPASLALTITPRTLTPTVSGGSYVYGSPTAVLGLSGLVNGDAPLPVATLDGTSGVTMAANGTGYGFGQKVGAGTSSFTLTGLSGAAAGNYTLDLSGATTGTIAIAPKPLTFVTGSGSQTYGTAGVSANAATSGVLAGDSVLYQVVYEANGTGYAFGARLPAGTYATTVSALSGADAGNYTIAASGNTDGSFTVNPKAITWSVANAAGTYGTLATPGAATFNGVLAGDDVTSTVSTFSGSTPFTLGATTHAGSYGEQVTGLAGADAGNYVLAGGGNLAGTLTIAPKALTYIGASLTQTYGSTALPAMTLSGIVGTDDVAGVVAIAGGSSDVGGSGARTVGHYDVSLTALSGANAADYTLALANNTLGSLTITPKALTFSTASSSSTYGTAATLAAPVLSGVLAGDVITGVATATDGISAFAPAAGTRAGTYAIGVQSADLSGAGASNYVIATTGNTPGSLVVAPKAITWQVASGTAVYGDAPTSATTFNGVLGGDVVTAQLTALDAQGAAIARPDVGSWHAGVAVLTGADAGNYTLSGSGNTPGALTVVPRTLTYTIANGGAVYGDAPALGAVTFNNLMSGDDPGAVEAISTFGHPVALTSRTHAGSYDETLTGLTNPDYVLATTGNTSGVYTVAPRPLDYTTADAASTYGTAAAMGSATLAGVLAGDSVTAATPVLQATGAASSATQDVGAYAIALRGLGGADASNYTVTDTGSTLGTLTISPKTVTYSLQGAFTYTGFGAFGGGSTYQNGTLTYGMVNGDLPRALVTINGAVAGDDVSVSTNTLSFPRSGSGNLDVGTYTYTGGALTGAKAHDYVLAATGNTTSATLTIVPQVVDMSVQANATGQISNQAYYGNTGSFQLAGSVSNVLAGDDVSVASWFALPGGNTTTLPDRLGVGSYAMGGALQGADAGNYVARPNIGSFSVLPRVIGINSSNMIVTYGDAATVPGAALDGVLSGDDVGAVTSVAGVTGAGNALPARLAAGAYGIQVTGLSGTAASNYVLASSALDAQSFGVAYQQGTLTVAKRQLAYAIDPASFNVVYGTTTAGGAMSGVLPGDTVGLDETLQSVQVHGVASSNAYPTGEQLPVGTYNWHAVLTGASAADYYIAGGPWFGLVTVSPKPLSVVLNPIDTVYGSYVAPSYNWVGLVAGDAITPNLTVTADATGKATSYNAQTGAGSYTQAITGMLAPSGVSPLNDPTLNYTFVATSADTARLHVAPKQLTFTPATDSDVVYGTAVPLGTLAGVLFGDDVGLQTVAATGMPAQRVVADGSGVLDYTTRIDAGSYSWSSTLVGAASGNYTVAPPSGSFSVAQKQIIYAVDNAQGQHGNYQACDPTTGCYPWTPGAVLGTAHFEGTLPGDDVGGSVAITDLNGQLVTLDNRTPVGQYFEVVTGLTGSAAKNYKVADSGSLPGLFTVTPEWVTYATSSGLYLQGAGMVGSPGVPTLRGPGGAFSDPNLTPIVQATDNSTGAVLPDFSHLTANTTYSFRVVALTGADAGDFRLMPDGTGNGSAYAQNDIGTLTTFSSTALGFGLGTVGQPPVPSIPSLPTPPAVQAPPLTGYVSSLRSNGSDGDTDFGRDITGTGTATDTHLGPTGGGAGATASGAAEGGVDLGGGVDLSGQASGDVSALAKFGIKGVTLQADAEAHVDVTIQVGAGYVEFGAQGDAYAIATATRTGGQLSAEAQAGASAQGGAAGDLGGGVDGNVDGTVTSFVFARTDDSVGLVDGHIVATARESAGVGVSVGVAGGISGSAGSVDAGATIYSPGSVGGGFNYSAGYSDGDLTMSFDIGAALGFGGLDLKFGFSINLGSSFNDAIDDLGEMFGIVHHSTPTPPTAAQLLRTDYDMSVANDPAARFAALDSDKDWMNAPNQSVAGMTSDQVMARDVQYYKTLAFYNSYNTMLSDTLALGQQEAATQAKLLGLLKTDPAAAIAYAHSTDFTAMAAEEAQIKATADSLGVSLAVVDGKLNYVDTPKP